MVRTRADGCAATRKAVAARAPRKMLSGGGSSSDPSSSSSSSSLGKYSGGNPVCVQPTPGWQKNIDTFFSRCSNSSGQEGTSSLEGADIESNTSPGSSSSEDS